jgi:hypothetical protein
MLTAFVFDVDQSKQVDDWAPALERLDQGQLLWVAMHDPTEEEVAALQETLELGDTLVRRNDYRLDRRQLPPRLGRCRERAGGVGREGHDQHPQRGC